MSAEGTEAVPPEKLREIRDASPTVTSFALETRRGSLEDLESPWRKATSSLVACRGRRRIGKLTMIREFARRSAQDYIEIEGLPPDRGMTNRRQLDHFVETLANRKWASSSRPSKERASLTR